MSVKLPGPRMPLLPTLQFMRNPVGMMRQSFERYGDPFVVTLPTGLTAVTRKPEGIKEVFTADSNLFEPGARTAVEPAMGSNSMILISGEHHRRERKLIMPMFHGERMRSYGTQIQEIARRAVANLSPGAPLTAEELNNKISLEVIIRTVFGVEEPERVRRFMEQIVVLVHSYDPLLALLPSVRKPWFRPWARFAKVRQELNDLLMEQIQRRRASHQQSEDVLSLMVSTKYEDGSMMKDEEVRDELRTLLLAGHDTTSITMTWAMYYIHRFPEVKRKVEEELAPLGPSPSPEALVKLPYLGAVLDECLRMHPVLAMTARKLLAPFTLLGHELPAGMVVATSIIGAHYAPERFPEPDRFRPERFLERKYTPFEYLPFGGGHRRCIGTAFAIYEAKVILGTLLATHRFSLTSNEEVKVSRRNLSLGLSSPIPMRYEGLVHGVANAA